MQVHRTGISILRQVRMQHFAFTIRKCGAPQSSQNSSGNCSSSTRIVPTLAARSNPSISSITGVSSLSSDTSGQTQPCTTSSPSPIAEPDAVFLQPGAPAAADHGSQLVRRVVRHRFQDRTPKRQIEYARDARSASRHAAKNERGSVNSCGKPTSSGLIALPPCVRQMPRQV